MSADLSTPEFPRQCTAHSKRSGARCRRPAILGGTVCWHHGGSAPQVASAAARRLEKIRVEGEIAALLEQLGVDDDVDPLEVLLDAVRRSHTMARLLQVLVAGLAATPGATAAGEPTAEGKPRAALYGPDHLGDARPHALVVLFERWNTEAARTAKLALDAGVEVKRLEREERVVDELVGAMSAFSEAIGAALELALVAAGVDAQLVRQARLDAEPEAFRRALGAGEVVDAASRTQTTPEPLQ